MDGGALTWNQTLDLDDILDEIMWSGKSRVLDMGTVGLVIKSTAPVPLPFVDTASKTKVKTIVLKIVPLKEVQAGEVKFVGMPESEIHDEYRKQLYLNNSCIQKFGFSIFPTPIRYKVTTMMELGAAFPFFEKIRVTNRFPNVKVGVIFMEMANSGGKVGTMAEVTNRRANPLGRRLLYMLAQLGYLHGDFHKGNFFKSGNGFVIGDLGRARPLTSRERALFNKNLSKRDVIRILYGFEDMFTDFTTQYYYVKNGDAEHNQFVKNYQWVRTDDDKLSSAIDDVEFASKEEVRRSLGFE